MADRPDELFLIDGNSLAYRAFFALPESIATSTGQPTNAIFGFASMLVKLLTEYGVKPTIVVWDAGSSGRKELSADYKAQRTSRPDLLKEQWPHLLEIVEAFGYRNTHVDGYEADDVIASIAQRAREADPPVRSVVVTGDRDAFQIIDDDGMVAIMATGRGITDTKLYDRQAVIDRYGLAPELIPDFYGLKGDTSDNIPGVPGIGDKTGATLLQQFGDLEGVLANVENISGAKRKENLTNHADDARLSKQLATIQRDVPVDIDPTHEAAREPDRSKLREVFRRFELRAPLSRLEEALGVPDPAHPGDGIGEGIPGGTLTGDVQLTARVREATIADLRVLPPGQEVALAVTVPEAPEGELFAIDAEARFGVSVGDGGVLTGPCADAAEVIAALGDRPVVVHDAKAVGPVPPNLAHDTLLGAYLLEPARRGYPFAELCEERGLATKIEDPAAATSLLTSALAAWQREQLTERGLESLLHDVELPLVGVLASMEAAGMRLDKARLALIKGRVDEEIGQLERDVWELAGEEFVLGSPQQLGHVLFEKLGLSRKRRGKTGFSTDARVLQAIREEHPVIPKIERWRELNQLSKTYLDVLPHLTDAEDRIHTTFLQAVAQTGRLSSTNPNMQNVPVRTELGREIRGCFRAADGHVLVSADYSQVELRILAHVADEPVLKEIFIRGDDVHTATASTVFQKPADQLTPMDRSKAKMINYGIVYGLSDFGLADRLNIPREEAKAFIDTYLERFPKVAQFMADTIAQAKEDGHVTTLYGRRRQIPELRARNYQVRTLGERLAVNTVIQGTAADVMKLAMIEAFRALAASGLAARMILTVHDELVFEAPESEADAVAALAVETMTKPWPYEPPLAVDVGYGVSWMDAK
ncbi:DNA polymerase I [Paraconexibacter antarcticus]|uniref:DNA polymerase I n=1 Tax=Paraconexibacter antarcticus TaxID=2949664 RepID=A0ABY5DLT2_9ACTN|nr:DNA polymerase I [Paraconexibacter antarcticus]UTI62456.1 DNA polymerase I [Paraconexibacter antarcticus]